MLNSSTVVLLILTVLTGGLWLRGGMFGDQFAWSSNKEIIGFNSQDGYFAFYKGRRYLMPYDPDGFFHRTNDPRMPRFDPYYNYIHPDDGYMGANWTGMVIPAGRLFAIFFLLLMWRPLRSIALELRVPKRPRNRGTCARCGYDLRATPWRCPECGLEPAHPTSASQPPSPQPPQRVES